MRLHTFLTFIVIALAPAFARPAHSAAHAPQQTAQQQADRKKFFQEARELKHQFFIKELSLTKTQQKQFFELYDRMEDEIHKVQRETRQMEKRVEQSGDKATDLEYEKATDAIYEAKQKECEIEQRYRSEYKKILSPAQMFKLKGAERKFSKVLMERTKKLNTPPAGGPKKK